ncbi:hypothetical protein J8273_6704 [Carpediemonas membranifera]|uniref:Uncharacterized protein n=1 Tax=Carpediemonas membranifera TaxID=201153 RepID=A0A8J6E8I9_9EUKA|nr:hypothetical protein J8273_6704 [Carpediemonas membranifera]|eukprot:KAG9391975.1 hypothetical protein J8273_6704 [Carpediemonas membranifera]
MMTVRFSDLEGNVGDLADAGDEIDDLVAVTSFVNPETNLPYVITPAYFHVFITKEEQRMVKSVLYDQTIKRNAPKQRFDA